VYGDLITLYVICACVVGGISLAGGVGGATRALLGLLMFGVMQNALNMLSIDPYVQDLIIGIVIVAIIGLDSYSRKRKREIV
jgi:ribose/xylose/arabinose/galactoside ABC-type transport system permease subunit